MGLLALRHGATLPDLGRELYDDEEIVLLGIAKDREDIKYASNRLKENPKIAYTALDGHFPYVEYWRASDIDGYYNHDILKYIGPGLKKDISFIEEIIRAFLKTSYGKYYCKNDFAENPFDIYEVLNKIRDSIVLNYGEELEDCLDMTEALFFCP